MKTLLSSQIKYFSNTITIGLLGYPNVGKSTYFNTLAKKEKAFAANFPFSTINPNITNIGIEDYEMLMLSKHFKKFKLKPYEIKLVDIAGLIKDSSKDENCLKTAYTCDAFIQVIRCFEDKEIQYMDDKINPSNEIDIITTELIMNDINKIDKMIASKEKQIIKNKNNKSSMKISNMTRVNIFYNVFEELNNFGKEVDTSNNNDDDNIITIKDNLVNRIKSIIRSELKKEIGNNDIILESYYNEITEQLNLLCEKKIFYLLNSNTSHGVNKYTEEVVSLLKESKKTKEENTLSYENDYFILSIKNQRDIVSLCEESKNITEFYDNLALFNLETLETNSNDDKLNDSESNVKAYMALNALEKLVLKKLDYKKFYTVTGDSNIISSYLVKNNSNILEAADLVHSDFKDKFMFAEISTVSDFIKYSSEEELKLNKKIIKANKDFIIDKNNYVIKFFI